MTNDGDATVSGTLARGARHLGRRRPRGGLAHERRRRPGNAIELAPGESITLPGSFETRRCDAGDEPLDAAADLPPLAAGSYAIRAVVGFLAFDPESPFALVSPARAFIVE